MGSVLHGGRSEAALSSSWARVWPALSPRFVCKRVFPVGSRRVNTSLPPFLRPRISSGLLALLVFPYFFSATFHFPFSAGSVGASLRRFLCEMENCAALNAPLLLFLLIISMIYALLSWVLYFIDPDRGYVDKRNGVLNWQFHFCNTIYLNRI